MEGNNEELQFLVPQIKESYQELTAKAILPLIPVCMYAIVQLIKHGSQNDYSFLLIGSVLSVATLIGYSISIAMRENEAVPKKSFLAALLIYGGLVPWAFGTYIVLIDGFWSLTNLEDGFSMFIILKAVVFVFLGYTVVSNLHRMTEIGGSIYEGNFDDQDK